MARIFHPDYQTICIIFMIATLLLTGIHLTLIATTPGGGEEGGDSTGPGTQYGKINSLAETDLSRENTEDTHQGLGAGLHR